MTDQNQLAEVEALRDLGWQPIATAPRPSLFDPLPGRIVELMWETHRGHRAMGYFGGSRGPTWYALPHGLPCGAVPTHWRDVKYD